MGLTAAPEWCKYALNSTGALCGIYRHRHDEIAPSHEFQPERTPPPPPQPTWVPVDRADLRDGDRVREIYDGTWAGNRTELPLGEGAAGTRCPNVRYERLSPSTETAVSE